MNKVALKKKTINGILILDKPSGCTSNYILQKVKRLYMAKKAGHTGSLDPIATGVLPICFGEATKFSQFLLDADKTYRTHAKLGITTDTGDCEGRTLSEQPVPRLSQEHLEKILESFKGQQQQVPSMYSALKHQGRPLYEYARKGIEIARPARDINIQELELESFTEDTLVLKVSCSKGTYIRSLVEDIGQAIGCGAHVSLLERLKSGPFKLSESITISELNTLSSSHEALTAKLLPVSAAIPHLPEIALSGDEAKAILSGQKINAPSLGQADDRPIKLFYGGQFIGIGERFTGDANIAQLKPKRLLQSSDSPLTKSNQKAVTDIFKNNS